MLDPADPLMLALLWLTLAAILLTLGLRTFRRDQREYRRFKRFRTTGLRQRMLRRWLIISCSLFGGLALIALLASGQFVLPLLREVRSWPWISWLLVLVTTSTSLTIGVIIGLVIAVIALTIVGVIAVRSEGEGLVSIGDIQAILPRNRQELVLGGLLSINAGIVEELLFRLALPALIFAVTGSAIVAVVVSLAIFGAMHSYQGILGIVMTTLIGAVFLLIYVVSGSILLAVIAHAVLDLRSLVIIPMAVSGVHRLDGRINPLGLAPPSVVAEPATPATPVTPTTEATPATKNGP
ncbi:MAG: CPBP family intramembrane glutamic endopeptidase [Rhodoglobus sp.]